METGKKTLRACVVETLINSDKPLDFKEICKRVGLIYVTKAKEPGLAIERTLRYLIDEFWIRHSGYEYVLDRLGLYAFLDRNFNRKWLTTDVRGPAVAHVYNILHDSLLDVGASEMVVNLAKNELYRNYLADWIDLENKKIERDY